MFLFDLPSECSSLLWLDSWVSLRMVVEDKAPLPPTVVCTVLPSLTCSWSRAHLKIAHLVGLSLSVWMNEITDL